jgi:hypothetical protein
MALLSRSCGIVIGNTVVGPTPETRAVPGYVLFGAESIRHELRGVPNASGTDEWMARNWEQSGRSGRQEAEIVDI